MLQIHCQKVFNVNGTRLAVHVPLGGVCRYFENFLAVDVGRLAVHSPFGGEHAKLTATKWRWWHSGTVGRRPSADGSRPFASVRPLTLSATYPF